MRILYHHRVASRDGQFVHIDAIISALEALGHEVIIVSPSVSQTTNFGDDGGWVSKLRKTLPGFVSELLEFGYSFYDFIKLIQAIRKYRPDAIYERYNIFLPSGIWAKQLFNLPLILEVNSPLYKERYDYTGIHFPMLAKWSEYYTWRNADHLLPVSHVMANYLYEAGVSEDQITVIPNGIDPALFNTENGQQREPRFEGKTVVGFVGFCREWHQLDKVMEMIAQSNNPNTLLLIVGDGPVLNDLKEQAKKLNLSNQVHLTGLVDRKDMPHWLAQIDIALQPAVTPWCSPLKLIEYLATGKAIVAPDADNIKELLRDSENALLFKQDNLDSMLPQIRRLIDDEALADKMKRNAKQTIKEKQLTWRQNGEKIIYLFNTLLSNELAIQGERIKTSEK
ncbi:glycosyltransferase family 1 protein [Photobacterium sanctipauli]|uniref:Glycosyltransferase family 1 protein n=1 Tax=Photobacterium sanctipauli TaxID=1342794 RepID=A0A2T3NYC4_9GAMM|nr:glycosyltransferase family 4 protein [Photobacterium sanctipauli]PSW21209.1 glycosyltransferase family 1 protein [Photobacterium sanctipauli]